MTLQKKTFWPWFIFFTVIMGILYMIQGILLPFISGLFVAYILSSGNRYLESLGLPRPVATLLLIVSFLLAIGLLLFIAIPFIQTELLRLTTHIPQYGERVLNSLKPYFSDPAFHLDEDDLTRLRNIGSTYLIDVVTWIIRVIVGILTGGLALANLISLLVITPIVAFYFLRDWNLMIATVDNWLPRPQASSIRQIIREIHATLSGFARGQIFVCLSLGIYYTVALSLIHLDFSIIVGSIIGLIAFIPYVGAFVGFILSFGIGLAQFSDTFSLILIIAIFVAGQTFEGYFLIPYLVGDRIGLHPIWVIFAILAGGVVLGFVGILLALPIAAALGVLLRHGLHRYKQSIYYLGQDTIDFEQKKKRSQTKHRIQ